VKVEQVCNLDLVAVDVTDTLADAARKMVRYRVGALPVIDEGKLVDVLSESDIMTAIDEDASLAGTCVDAYMTEGAITVRADDDASLAARRMLEHRIHHLPVLDGDSAIGMVSTGDLLAAGVRAVRR
jgi:CBS domain-containing protein